MNRIHNPVLQQAREAPTMRLIRGVYHLRLPWILRMCVPYRYPFAYFSQFSNYLATCRSSRRHVDQLEFHERWRVHTMFLGYIYVTAVICLFYLECICHALHPILAAHEARPSTCWADIRSTYSYFVCAADCREDKTADHSELPNCNFFGEMVWRVHT